MHRVVVFLSVPCGASDLRNIVALLRSFELRKRCLTEWAACLEHAGYAYGVSELCLIVSTASSSGCSNAILQIRSVVDEFLVRLGLKESSRSLSVITVSDDLEERPGASSKQLKVASRLREVLSSIDRPEAVQAVVECEEQIYSKIAELADLFKMHRSLAGPVLNRPEVLEELKPFFVQR